MSGIVSIRLSEDTLNVINELILYKIVKNKTEAVNYIMEHGLNYVNQKIKKKKKTEELLNIYLHNGLPELPANLSDRSIKERE